MTRAGACRSQTTATRLARDMPSQKSVRLALREAEHRCVRWSRGLLLLAYFFDSTVFGFFGLAGTGT